MKDVLRLLILVVVILPLTLLLIGPALVLAALRGRQKMGPIVLKPGRRGVAGRVGALLLGLLIWLLVWGGLAAVIGGVVLPAIRRSRDSRVQVIVIPTTAPEIATAQQTSVASPAPSPTITPTPTHPPQQEEPTPSPSPAPPTSTPSPLPPTPTPVLPTVTTVPPTPTIAATATATATPAFPITPVATLAPSEATEAIKAIEAANEMLRAAVVESSIGNMAALETLWRDEALAKAQAFAQDFNQRYLRPLEVTFVYLAPPLAIKGDSPDTAYVISTEAWNYTGPKATHDESLEFTYSLRREDEGWVIIDYTYGNAPITSPSGGEGRPTLTPAPGTITAPVVVTPAAP